MALAPFLCISVLTYVILYDAVHRTLINCQVDWKPNRVADLIAHLCSVVRQQYTELHRSLVTYSWCRASQLDIWPHRYTRITWTTTWRSELLQSSWQHRCFWLLLTTQITRRSRPVVVCALSHCKCISVCTNSTNFVYIYVNVGTAVVKNTVTSLDTQLTDDALLTSCVQYVDYRRQRAECTAVKKLQMCQCSQCMQV